MTENIFPLAEINDFGSIENAKAIELGRHENAKEQDFIRSMAAMLKAYGRPGPKELPLETGN